MSQDSGISETPEHLAYWIGQCLSRGMTGKNQQVERGEVIQSLWSGYGEIVRYYLRSSPVSSAVLKRVDFPTKQQHPRGWNSPRSHQRKWESYRVESHWYQHWGKYALEADCRMPRFYGLHMHAKGYWMLLEDLNASGYEYRHQSLSFEMSQAVVKWLERFHARFLNWAPKGLWERGSYWHLATRPDEFEAMVESPLKQSAKQIDQLLRQSPYQTLLHGDAKLANFCFGEAQGVSTSVAAVDFQYIGPGTGMQDLSYFLGSCFDEQECEQYADNLLALYFQEFRAGVKQRKDNEIQGLDLDVLEADWRRLYPVAWADFQRFLLGWMPEHPKLNAYSQRMTEQALQVLKS